ncbi:hypothetical protein PBCV1_A555aR [Paramecium bursaria Chlorella virus 1]|uniref:Uncharacterized protein n=1 Tax=Paramecium bursaria Chlorella virus 1 TaxID=10506 RepID=F8TU58_PBCV1|nr:hypothetical protein PBCV1_A555aR [Paramecium bursaria Chlorella virus 1]AEI70119.1 hypothetical protein [Paramecium bursaria Chlorella virus 1]
MCHFTLGCVCVYNHRTPNNLTIININSQRTIYHVSLGIRFGVPFE